MDKNPKGLNRVLKELGLTAVLGVLIGLVFRIFVDDLTGQTLIIMVLVLFVVCVWPLDLSSRIIDWIEGKKKN